MESIVSPWIIYLLWKVDCLRTIIGIPVVISLVGFIAFILVSLTDYDGKQLKEHAGTIKKVICIWFFLAFFVLIVPSKNTIIAMYAANEVTYNRVEKAVDITKDIKNSLKRDIIDIIQEVSKPEKADK